MEVSLKGKVALVAGGGGAIGAEMARALAAFGAKIAVGKLFDGRLQVVDDLHKR